VRKFIWMITLCCGLLTVQIRADELDKNFAAPPDSARPHTWWHWMNGNITKKGITADLEAMQRVGIGGAQIFHIGSGIPAGPVKFLSPEWRGLMQHAAQEADRLGLELCIQNCPGWSNSGGPWNTPENSMQKIIVSETLVKGPARFSDVLPRPATEIDFYRDIEVLAFPTTEGEEVTMKSLAPKVTASITNFCAADLFDGNHDTAVTLLNPESREMTFIQFEFSRPLIARSFFITFGGNIGSWRGSVQTSDDGRDFRDMQSFTFSRNGGIDTMSISLGTNPASAKFYRVKFINAKQVDVAEISFSPCLRTDNAVAKSGMNNGRLNGWRTAEESSIEPGFAVKRAAITNITSRMKPDGRLDWDVPAGQWTILRIGHTPTGTENHPAPEGGKGLECDKLSTAALDAHWAGYVQKILDDIGPLAGKGKAFNNVLLDSYEAGGQNWTPNFREEFQQRRGYDPLPWFVAITGRVVDSPEASERFLWDMRRTVADLFAEKYYGHFKELCNQRGLMASIEPYNGPYESLQSGGPADIPMGEFWVGEDPNPSVKLAATVGHIYGKPIIGAESFTARPGKVHGRWLDDPYAFKADGDRVFCKGINRYIFHRYAMQPWTNRAPGMTMGQWGSHLDRTSTWWEQGRAWMKYIARCQFMLQQGRFVADAAAFCGESAPVQMPAINPELPPGYDYDGINADVLLNHASMKDGRLVLKSGMSYRVLTLSQPDRTMTPKLLNQLHSFVADGLTLVGPPPEKSPGLEGYPKCDAEVKSLAAEMWDDCDGKTVTEHQFGKGKVVWGQTMAQVFAMLNTKPDFEFAANGGSQLMYIHRLDVGADIYFVSNQRDQFDSVDCTFRVTGKIPELWYPDTGRIEQASVWRDKGGCITVPLQFDPAGSVFVVFRRPAGSADHIVSAAFSGGAATNKQPVLKLISDESGRIKLCALSPGKAELRTASGKNIEMEVRDIPKPVEVSGSWELTFPPNWGAPAQINLPKLISWTEHADSGVKYFSGTATYIKEVEIPAGMFGAGRLLWLDLGWVKNIAEVSVNGRPQGILWKPPFRANITDAAKPGKNKLEIKVTNLWPNRLIGDEQLLPDCQWSPNDMLRAWPRWLSEGKPSPAGRLTFTTWHHWKKDDALVESGLLGPVTVQAEIKSEIKP
jgi:hypothetical protein